MLVDKKEFALSQIAPYFKDNSLCGYDTENNICLYKTNDNKMCVAGKNFVNGFYEQLEIKQLYWGLTDFFKVYSQNDLFGDKANILTNQEWIYLQSIHDCIAHTFDVGLKEKINKLALFTYDELVEYANKLN